MICAPSSIGRMRLGLGVILDVVYNHIGPDGNYLAKFAKSYFSDRHKTDWGEAINFDGPQNAPVREFYLENAAYWIREFHLDGLRLDATQDIHDTSKPHILADITCRARAAAGERSIILIGENEPQQTSLVKPLNEGGCGHDGLWNDDYHHTAMVALTGKSDAYYTDYGGSPQELLSAAKYGYLYQGQFYRWQHKRRGTPTFGLRRSAMINFIQNHDQIANSARGQRIQEDSHPGTLKAITALTLLAPGTPMLFQGQEFGASSCFHYFADHKPELAKMVEEGRVEFLHQWRSLSMPEMQHCFAPSFSPGDVRKLTARLVGGGEAQGSICIASRPATFTTPRPGNLASRRRWIRRRSIEPTVLCRAVLLEGFVARPNSVG